VFVEFGVCVWRVEVFVLYGEGMIMEEIVEKFGVMCQRVSVFL